MPKNIFYINLIFHEILNNLLKKHNNINMKLIKSNFFKCGIAGWCLEIFWTGFGSLLSLDRKMTGTTSLLMFPIYGLAACFKPIYNFLKNRSTILRGGVYTVIIFTAEYCFGLLLRSFEMCPWDYSGTKYNVNGLIRLDYAPAWFLAGLIMERIVRK